MFRSIIVAFVIAITACSNEQTKQVSYSDLFCFGVCYTHDIELRKSSKISKEGQ